MWIRTEFKLTKPAQASKNKKSETLSIYSGLGVYRLHVFVLCCFDARASFVKIMLSLFDFCAAKMNKNVFHQHARLSSCIKHCKLLVFCACFLSKTTPPHGGPLSKEAHQFSGVISLAVTFTGDIFGGQQFQLSRFFSK